MSLFTLILIALWFYPVFAILASRFPIGKRMLPISFASATFILVALSVGLSTISDVVDGLIISTLYFSWLMLLLYIYSLKNSLVKLLSGFIIFSTIMIGYVSGSVGILGVGLILNDFEVERTIYLTHNVVYKQYNLGSAPGDYRGIKISIVKRPIWLPGLEYDVFTKTYTRAYLSPKYPPSNTAVYPTLYSDDFEVKYNNSSKTIILMDTIMRDTINLK